MVRFIAYIQIIFSSRDIDDTTFTMKADSTHTSNLGRGRESVRLVSNDKFGDGVYIFDIGHMPLGCGTVSHRGF